MLLNSHIITLRHLPLPSPPSRSTRDEGLSINRERAEGTAGGRCEQRVPLRVACVAGGFVGAR